MCIGSDSIGQALSDRLTIRWPLLTGSYRRFRPGSDDPVIVVDRPETDVQVFCVPPGRENHAVKYSPRSCACCTRQFVGMLRGDIHLEFLFGWRTVPKPPKSTFMSKRLSTSF